MILIEKAQKISQSYALSDRNGERDEDNWKDRKCVLSSKVIASVRTVLISWLLFILSVVRSRFLGHYWQKGLYWRWIIFMAAAKLRTAWTKAGGFTAKSLGRLLISVQGIVSRESMRGPTGSLPMQESIWKRLSRQALCVLQPPMYVC